MRSAMFDVSVPSYFLTPLLIGDGVFVPDEVCFMCFIARM